MARIVLTYGSEHLDHIDGLTPAVAFAKAERAVEVLARRNGHRLSVRTVRGADAPSCDVHSNALDREAVESRLERMFLRRFSEALDDAIQGAS